jgi:flagellar hook assembly protein FlgD
VYGTGTGATKGNGKKSRGVQRYAYIAQTRLLANAPNPFNPTTTVRFELAGTSLVRIDLYDASGALVQTLVNESREAGTHGIEWNGDDRFGRPVASGVYFARLQVNGTLVDTHKMLLLK